jgi:hypothetical protein
MLPRCCGSDDDAYASLPLFLRRYVLPPVAFGPPRFSAPPLISISESFSSRISYPTHSPFPLTWRCTGQCEDSSRCGEARTVQRTENILETRSNLTHEGRPETVRVQINAIRYRVWNVHMYPIQAQRCLSMSTSTSTITEAKREMQALRT